jgi:hypothetical protein
LTILGIIGPAAFALSIFPGFGNAVGNWISKYIGFYMWAPVLNLLELLVVKMQGLVLKQSISIDPSVMGGGNGGIWMLVVMQVIAVVVYMATPVITTWIVPNADSGQSMSGVTRMGTFLAAHGGAKTGSMASRGYNSVMDKLTNAVSKIGGKKQQ